MRRILIFLVAVAVARTASFLDYTEQHTLNCNNVPNLPSLWYFAVTPRNILVLHLIDRYLYLILCPILIVLECVTFAIFAQHKQLRERPGDIIMGILLTSIILNVHFLATASNACVIRSL